MGEEFKMNLQLFAEGEEANTAATPAATEPAEPSTNASSGQTFTLEEVTKLIQSEADKRVTQALAKQKKDYEKKLSLSNLGENERQLAEKDNEINDLKTQIEELSQYRIRQGVMNELSARNLDPKLVDVIALTNDEAELKTRIDTFETAYRAAVENAVKSRLSGSTPTKGSSPAGLTRDEFRKMTLMQQQDLYKRDPETYKRLTEG